jgi:hypothetical protein
MPATVNSYATATSSRSAVECSPVHDFEDEVVSSLFPVALAFDANFCGRTPHRLSPTSTSTSLLRGAPTTHYLPFNTLKAVPALSAPVDLPLMLLHDARFTSRSVTSAHSPLRGAPSPSPSPSSVPSRQLHALTRLVLLCPPPIPIPTPRLPREARLFTDGWK